jgi:hypothetical protein
MTSVINYGTSMWTSGTREFRRNRHCFFFFQIFSDPPTGTIAPAAETGVPALVRPTPRSGGGGVVSILFRCPLGRACFPRQSFSRAFLGCRLRCLLSAGRPFLRCHAPCCLLAALLAELARNLRHRGPNLGRNLDAHTYNRTPNPVRWRFRKLNCKKSEIFLDTLGGPVYSASGSDVRFLKRIER